MTQSVFSEQSDWNGRPNTIALYNAHVWPCAANFRPFTVDGAFGGGGVCPFLPPAVTLTLTKRYSPGG
ncbi:hypothetical protein GWI33_007934 [Rhynchophorus ferrugineus]|uniref:Uncharacterized protein n=1 Tax=Rhynchophorus ferrugineus TaxID=354439 RepID=A0A834MHX6_RHYFE|nr:hypothetical protein GWI33_007934 [Rhynchophorus ferrugineus]